MFEKEAEERTEEKYACSKNPIISLEAIGYKKGYKDGAEFGYNKANEWHFTKDGDYPKEYQLVLLYRENPNGANLALSYWYKSYVNDKVIAWKEIVPPKEIAE
jgi:hypothetical protein